MSNSDTAMVQWLQPYFTKSKYYPDNPELALEDAKLKYKKALQEKINRAEKFTLDYYYKASKELIEGSW